MGILVVFDFEVRIGGGRFRILGKSKNGDIG